MDLKEFRTVEEAEEVAQIAIAENATVEKAAAEKGAETDGNLCQVEMESEAAPAIPVLINLAKMGGECIPINGYCHNEIRWVKQQAAAIEGLSESMIQLFLADAGQEPLRDHETILELMGFAPEELNLRMVLVQRYETAWCTSVEGKGIGITLKSPRTAKAIKRGNCLRGSEPIPSTGVHYFEITYSVPERPAGGAAGGYWGHSCNVSFGVVGPNVSPHVYSTASDSEPSLHFLGYQGEPHGFWGISEDLDRFEGYRTRTRINATDKNITADETVGVLVNMNVRALRIFRQKLSDRSVCEISGLPEVVYPVAAPYAAGSEANISFPQSQPEWV